MKTTETKSAATRVRREDPPPQADEMLAYEEIARAQLDLAIADTRPPVFAVITL